MNPSRLKGEFLPRYRKIEEEAEKKLEAIRAEIRKEYGWDGKWVQITLEVFPDKKYRADLSDLDDCDEDGFCVGDVTCQPIGKKAAELLMEMGFPSGS
jgi:hypothetical protein